MKRRLLIGGVALSGLVVVVGGLLWYWMGQPLYRPGMVREGKNLRAPLTPPKQTGQEDHWSAHFAFYERAETFARLVDDWLSQVE